MALTTYTYSVSGDVAAQAVSLVRLDTEIRSSDVTVALDGINLTGDALDIVFKAALSGAEETTLDGLVQDHSGVPVIEEEGQPVYYADAVSKTTDGRLRVAVEKTDLVKVEYYTVDWTDPTTWYPQATRHPDVEAVNSGDNLTYDLVGHSNLIDLYHGKVNQEDFKLDGDGYSYRVSVVVNDGATDNPMTEKDPHTDVGDYTVDYVNGSITFDSAQNPAHTVKVTFHKATSSRYDIIPPPGMVVFIEQIEAQFSSDMGMTDSVYFQPVGPVEIFAPQLVDNPYPAGTMIPLQDPLVYKTMRNFQTDCYRAYPTYPALSPSTWRGTQNPTIVFDWDYLGATPIHSNLGMEVWVYLEHDTPFTGEYSTAAFYCTMQEDTAGL